MFTVIYKINFNFISHKILKLELREQSRVSKLLTGNASGRFPTILYLLNKHLNASAVSIYNKLTIYNLNGNMLLIITITLDDINNKNKIK